MSSKFTMHYLWKCNIRFSWILAKTVNITWSLYLLYRHCMVVHHKWMKIWYWATANQQMIRALSGDLDIYIYICWVFFFFLNLFIFSSLLQCKSLNSCCDGTFISQLQMQGRQLYHSLKKNTFWMSNICMLLTHCITMARKSFLLCAFSNVSQKEFLTASTHVIASRTWSCSVQSSQQLLQHIVKYQHNWKSTIVMMQTL